MQIGPEFLQGEQKLFVAGAGEEEDKDKTWYATMHKWYRASSPTVHVQYAEEADTRVWLHVSKASGSRKLLYSPDTDVYHIGLTNANFSKDEVIVQLSPIGRDLKLIHMNKFNEAISTDPDLSAIPVADRAKTLQALYIATGPGVTSHPFLLVLERQLSLKGFSGFQTSSLANFQLCQAH